MPGPRNYWAWRLNCVTYDGLVTSLEAGGVMVWPPFHFENVFFRGGSRRRFKQYTFGWYSAKFLEQFGSGHKSSLMG